jgi:hypothetical protein
MTDRAISPLIAAALCLKPRGQMTVRRVANVDALKSGVRRVRRDARRSNLLN